MSTETCEHCGTTVQVDKYGEPFVRHLDGGCESHGPKDCRDVLKRQLAEERAKTEAATTFTFYRGANSEAYFVIRQDPDTERGWYVSPDSVRTGGDSELMTRDEAIAEAKRLAKGET